MLHLGDQVGTRDSCRVNRTCLASLANRTGHTRQLSRQADKISLITLPQNMLGKFSKQSWAHVTTVASSQQIFPYRITTKYAWPKSNKHRWANATTVASSWQIFPIALPQNMLGKFSKQSWAHVIAVASSWQIFCLSQYRQILFRNFIWLQGVGFFLILVCHRNCNALSRCRLLQRLTIFACPAHIQYTHFHILLHTVFFDLI